MNLNIGDKVFNVDFRATVTAPPRNLDYNPGWFWLQEAMPYAKKQRSTENVEFLIYLTKVNHDKENEENYKALSTIFDGLLKDYISNDGEYALNVSDVGRMSFDTVSDTYRNGNKSYKSLLDAIEGANKFIVPSVLQNFEYAIFRPYKLTKEYQEASIEFLEKFDQQSRDRGHGRAGDERVVSGIVELSEDINWEKISNGINGLLEKEVLSQIEGNAEVLVGYKIQELVEKVSTQELQNSVRERMLLTVSLEVNNRLDSRPELRDLNAAQLTTLINEHVIKPRYERIIEKTAKGESYLDLMLEKILLDKKSHYLKENQGVIQEDLTDITRHIEKTTSELEIAEELKNETDILLKEHSQNNDIIEQSEKLGEKIEKLTYELVEKHRELEERKAETSIEEIDKKIHERSETLETRHRDIFERGV